MGSHEAERDEAERYMAEQWDRLLHFLNRLGPTRQLAPGRISLTLRETGRHVEIVMTPDEWDDMYGPMWGSFDDAAADVERSVLSASESEPYLVYCQYRLEPSPTPELPPDPDDERMQALLRANGGKSIGSWVALDNKGRVVGRFSDSPDTRT